MLNLFKRDFISILKERFKNCQDVEFEQVFNPISKNQDNYFTIIHLKGINIDFVKNILINTLENKIYHLDETLLTKVSEISTNNFDLIEQKLFSKEILTFNSLTNILTSISSQYENHSSNKILPDINDNLLTIRESIKSSKLKIRSYNIGSLTKTNVSLIYNEKLVDDEICKDIHNSLKRCTLESVISLVDLANIASGCKRSFLPVFAQTNNLNLCKKELEKGHFVILMNGQDQCLIGPCGLFGLIGLTLNDYPYLFLERIVKIIALILGLFLSGLMASLYLYHPNLMPFILLTNILNNQEIIILNLQSQFIISEIVLLLIKQLSDKLKFSLTFILGTLIIFGLVLANIIAIDVLLISVISITSLSLITIDKKTNDSLYIIHLLILIFSLLLGMLGFAFSVIFSIIFISSKKVFNQTYLYPLSPLDLPEMWNYLKGKIVK